MSTGQIQSGLSFDIDSESPEKSGLGPEASQNQTAIEEHGPESPEERQRPLTLDIASARPTLEERKAQRKSELASFSAILLFIFLEGWNDGTPGPMLPAMQRHYHVGFAVVSLIFVLNCVGFVLGALANIHLTEKLGFGKTLAIGAALQTLGYALQAPAPPFPVFVIAYFISGLGISIQAAQGMVFVVNLRNSTTKMGFYSAMYGIGALISPLVATQFASMQRWSYFFLISLGMSLVNIVTLCLVFRFERLEVTLTKAGGMPRERPSTQGNQYSQLLGLKVVHVLAFFTLAYVGVEVTIGGWIVTFVIDERGGGSSSGYLTSGFFAGLTFGRILLLWVNTKVGERRVVWLYICLAIGLEITVWFVPSLVGNAIAVSFVGLLLGPIYPIIMNRTGKLLPYSLTSGAVGWIAGLGQTGSAIIPFVTGALASKFGVMSLQPLVVSVLGTMLGLWALVPAEMHRSE